MVIVSFVGNSQADVKQQVRTYLDDSEREAPPAPLRGGNESSPPATSYAFVAGVLNRIPKGRVARKVLRDIALSTLRGENGPYYDLRARYAEDNGQRFAGYLQSITKAATSEKGEMIKWLPKEYGWSMEPDIAQALLDLLGDDEM